MEIKENKEGRKEGRKVREKNWGLKVWLSEFSPPDWEDMMVYHNSMVCKERPWLNILLFHRLIHK